MELVEVYFRFLGIMVFWLRGQLKFVYVIILFLRVDDIVILGGKGVVGLGGGDVLLMREDYVERIVVCGNGYCGEGQDLEQKVCYGVEQMYCYVCWYRMCSFWLKIGG